MRINFQLIIASIFATQISFGAFAQKANVTDAALLMKKYNPLSGLDASMKLLNKAKGFIDLAAVNSETAESAKMHMYRGEIYFGLIEMSAIEAATTKTEQDEEKIKTYESVAKASFNKVLDDPKKEFIEDINTFLSFRSNLAFNTGISAYEKNKFEIATQFFIGAIEAKSFLNEKYPEAEVAAEICLSKTVDSLIKIKNFDKAIELAEVVNEAIPSNLKILRSLIMINLQKGDNVACEKYLSESLALDPLDKQLYYVLGSTYMDLKENEKAERALSKALEIDSNYNDAQYQLGALLFNWGFDLKKEAGQLPENDTRYDPLIEKATAMQYRSLALIQAYDEKNPCNKDVFKILQQSYSKFGNNEKSEAYKMRLLIFTYLSSNDTINMTKYTNKTLEIDPNNKLFYFNLGISYMCLGQNDKANNALSKALEIDTAYNDAQYQLGTLLYKWADELKKEAEQLPKNDTRNNQLTGKASAMQYRSLALLEKYLVVNPLDKTVLDILISTYLKLGNNEKAAEYKKRIEALKKN
jgi:tetratricopeptide (TPR) repeat protein